LHFGLEVGPYRKNDQATIESKNNHVVRHYAFYYRYDTPETLKLLNQLWALVDDRMNYLTPTKKPTGWGQDKNGRRKRIYDKPKTPCERLLESGILSPQQQKEIADYRYKLNPAEINRQILAIQAKLQRLAANHTEELRRNLKPTKPDITKGVRLRVVA